MTLPALNVAVLRFDRTAGLLDGRVRRENVTFINAPGGPTAVEGILAGVFDVADVPLVQYVDWVARGLPFTAIPVFSDRLFQRPYVYTTADSGITTLAELRGRRVLCAPSYFGTPGFWHRALLEEEYGIAISEVLWHSASPLRGGKRYPDGVSVTYSPASYLGLERLLDGTVDCLMTARTALVPSGAIGRVRRVSGDAHERDAAWVRETGFFPILHVIAVRKDALERRPGFDEELCAAYDTAKAHAYDVLQDERMTSLPFMRRYLDETVATFGDDPWPYGVAANRAVLDRFLGYAHAQGWTDRRLAVDELFTPASAHHAFRARMTPGCITATTDGGWAAVPTLPDN